MLVPPSANPRRPGVVFRMWPAMPIRKPAIAFCDGVEGVVGGTSAVARWAALIARLNQQLGKPVGYLNPILYELPAKAAFRDIVSGNNNVTASAGPYPARKGWDACCGLGSPVGTKLASLL
jgi:kumamolisin